MKRKDAYREQFGSARRLFGPYRSYYQYGRSRYSPSHITLSIPSEALDILRRLGESVRMETEKPDDEPA